MPKKKKSVHVGYFSYGKNGALCYHEDVNRDPEQIKKALDSGVTGGPYTVIKAYIKVKQ